MAPRPPTCWPIFSDGRERLSASISVKTTTPPAPRSRWQLASLGWIAAEVTAHETDTLRVTVHG